MTNSEIRGVIPPLTTPFKEDGTIFEDGLRAILDFQIDKGSHGLFLCGTYGSGPLMSNSQRKKVVEIASDHVDDRIPIIVHVGSTSTWDSLNLSRHAQEAGAVAVASVPPYYYKHDAETVLEHFRRIVEAVNIPVYAYNNPRATGFSINPSVLKKMADMGVKGIKDSSYSMIEFTNFILELKSYPDFTFIVGTEALLLPAMLVGAKGCISGLANVFPELVVELYDAIEKKDIEKAVELQFKVNEARNILHIPRSTNAACYAVLKERGIDVGVPKLPIQPVSSREIEMMRREFSRLNIMK